MDARIQDIISAIDQMDMESKIAAINALKLELKKISPFAIEPVDCVQWVKEELVIANDYNPNSVAPPEMKLLHTSIQEDGYTQPIVVYQHDGIYEVVDGFHRNRVGKEYADIRERIHGYLPVTIINDERHDKADRIASTIRHNRARGKHRVEAMSDIVIELKRRNWSDAKIGRELGMDPDEVLRLTQITGLAEMFANQEFSEAWEVDMLDESDIVDETFEGDEE
jgi:ParB-like chromosome segregation protein Spo0J